MRKIYLIFTTLFISVLITSCAIVTTDIDPVTSVVQNEDLSKNDLYVKSNNWMVDTFNNAKSVIQFTDKESGTITGKYLLGEVMANSNDYAYATIKIRVKDGASKITITPQSFKYAKGNMYTLYTEEQAKKDISDLISSYEEYMQLNDDNNW